MATPLNEFLVHCTMMNKAFSRRNSLQQWAVLSAVCTDPESQRRLTFLHQQMDRSPGNEAVSSCAEVETAHFLTQAGFSVAFLEAAGGRTADLQCYAGSHRFFVEITVIQSTRGPVNKGGRHPAKSDVLLETGDDFFEQAFVRRLLARMAEKTKQLERYYAPVLLVVSVPDSPKGIHKPTTLPPVDLQRLAGLVVGVLAEAPQFSGLLLTFWNAPAQELRNPIRIRQVHCVTRPSASSEHPRIRLWATNPFARYRLTNREIRMIKESL